MFTGIIQAIGALRRLERRGGDVRIEIAAGKLPMHDVTHGESIACNGVCLTVVAFGGDYFAADVSLETLAVTTLGSLQTGSRLNLERAMALGDRLGGHLVSGHVDGIGEILALTPAARSTCCRVRAPRELARYIAHKGSIAVDGTSLTVNRVEGAEFELTIIPTTLTETIFGAYRAGTPVNLEVDIIARYLERLLQGDTAAEPARAAATITRDTLRQHGFDAE
jgi:riboflavin synthase